MYLWRISWYVQYTRLSVYTWYIMIHNVYFSKQWYVQRKPLVSKESVLLSNYTDVLSIYVEKAATKNTGHDKYAQYSVLMPSFGLSGKSADVERKLEFTAESELQNIGRLIATTCVFGFRMCSIYEWLSVHVLRCIFWIGCACFTDMHVIICVCVFMLI